jgi:hypothetical protein
MPKIRATEMKQSNQDIEASEPKKDVDEEEEDFVAEVRPRAILFN